MLEELNKETIEEIKTLSTYSQRISHVFQGYWSVDYACTRNGTWYLIDMANGYASYHPKCEKKLSVKQNK